MKNTCIYLDYNATCPVWPEVADEIRRYLIEDFGNPSCKHIKGKKALLSLEKARASIAELIEAQKEEIYFLSGGTEANNLALKGTAYAHLQKGHIITSQIEHPSVLNPVLYLKELGYEVTFVPVDSKGIVDPEDIKKTLRPHTFLISIMWANNETGALQPVQEIAAIAKERNILFHTDAAQAVGKIPVSVKKVKCDLLTIAGHKMYAPKGIGVLYVRRDIKIEPLFQGAGQEKGLRPGTEPVALAVGLGKAARLISRDLIWEGERQKKLREKLYEGLKEIYPPLVRYGDPNLTLPNTLQVSFYGLKATEILANLPQICVSTGAACHDQKDSISHVLKAMNVSLEAAQGTIRFSLGRGTTEEQIQETLDLFKKFWV